MSAWVIASSRYGLVLRRTMTLTACEVSLILVDAAGSSSIRATDVDPSPATSDRPRLHIGISRRMLANESRRICQIGFATAERACLVGRAAQKQGTTKHTDDTEGVLPRRDPIRGNRWATLRLPARQTKGRSPVLFLPCLPSIPWFTFCSEMRSPIGVCPHHRSILPHCPSPNLQPDVRFSVDPQAVKSWPTASLRRCSRHD